MRPGVLLITKNFTISTNTSVQLVCVDVGTGKSGILGEPLEHVFMRLIVDRLLNEPTCGTSPGAYLCSALVV